MTGAAFLSLVNPGMAGPDPPDVKIDEIFVTATRRSVSLQEVAGSVGIVTADIITATGALDVGDFWRLVPSLYYSDRGFAGERVTIRGLTASAINATGESMITTYLDDVPLIAPNVLFGQTPSFKLIDVERIEVLRGPQGTLFGAGSMGGAIRLITNKPDAEPMQIVDVRLSDTKGGGTNYGISGAVNVPIGERGAGLRTAAYMFSDDGFVDDINLRMKNKNSETTWGIRTSAAWTFGELLDLHFIAQHQDSEADGFPWVDPVGKPAINLGTSNDYQSVLFTDDLREESATLASLKLTYNTPAGVLTSSTSLVNSETDLLVDLSNEGAFLFGEYFPYHSPDRSETNVVSQEVRLVSNSEDAFEWLVGAFYMKQEFDGRSSLQAPGLNAICGDCVPLPDGEEFLLANRLESERRETGIFADLAYKVANKSTLNVGIRWFDLEQRDSATTNLVFPVTAELNSSAISNQSDWTGQISLSHKILSSAMIYAKASKGFRAGGVNEPAAATTCGVEPVYGPDELWNYEIGIRSTWLDGSLAANATLYEIDWHDARLLAFPACLFVIAVNTAGVTSRGLEAELSYAPFEALVIRAGIGLMSSELDRNEPVLDAPAGRRLPLVPDITANISATYDGTTDSGRAWHLRAGVQHVGGSRSDITEFGGLFPIARLPSYTLLDVRSGIQVNKWELSLFVENLTDEQPMLSCCGIVGEFVTTAPRTVGIRAIFRSGK